MFIMADVVIQRVIQQGIVNLRAKPNTFRELFATYLEDDMAKDYGETYVDKIWTWFTETKIPVVQSWSLNAERLPCYSIHLSSTNEDESKAAIGDYLGDLDGDDLGTGTSTVQINVGIHADKNSDAVLWLYYILNYILYKEKPMAVRLGLQLHTFSASEFDKDNRYLASNVWTRWCRVRGTVENWWPDAEGAEITDVKAKVHKGRVGDEDDEETL